MEKNRKKFANSGITLIALVITIIVLLILAAISIATLTGENGILTRANEAKIANEKGEAEDRIKLVLNEWQIEKNRTDGMNLEDFLNSKVASKELDKVTKNSDGTLFTVEVKGYEATINADGKIIEGKSTLLSGSAFGNKISWSVAPTEVEFVNTISGNPDSGYTDVSEAQDGSILAWFEGTKLYIGSENIIMANEDCTNLFANGNVTQITSIKFNNFNTSNVTNMSSMFNNVGLYANNFSLSGLENWDTSKVTNMSGMFNSAGYYGSENWSLGDISNWDTSSVTNMSNMFNSAGRKATNWSLDLSGWNTSNVTDMSSMFALAAYYGQTFSLSGLENWDTSSVTNMQEMFNQAGFQTTSLTIGDLSNWNTSNVTNMSNMFAGMGAYNTAVLTIGDLSNWNTSNVNDMSNIFSNNPTLVCSITIMNPNITYNNISLGDPSKSGQLTINYIDDVTKAIAETIVSNGASNIVLGTLITR